MRTHAARVLAHVFMRCIVTHGACMNTTLMSGVNNHKSIARACAAPAGTLHHGPFLRLPLPVCSAALARGRVAHVEPQLRGAVGLAPPRSNTRIAVVPAHIRPLRSVLGVAAPCASRGGAMSAPRRGACCSHAQHCCAEPARPARASPSHAFPPRSIPNLARVVVVMSGCGIVVVRNRGSSRSMMAAGTPQVNCTLQVASSTASILLPPPRPPRLARAPLRRRASSLAVGGSCPGGRGPTRPGTPGRSRRRHPEPAARLLAGRDAPPTRADCRPDQFAA